MRDPMLIAESLPGTPPSPLAPRSLPSPFDVAAAMAFCRGHALGKAALLAKYGDLARCETPPAGVIAGGASPAPLTLPSPARGEENKVRPAPQPSPQAHPARGDGEDQSMDCGDGEDKSTARLMGFASLHPSYGLALYLTAGAALRGALPSPSGLRQLLPYAVEIATETLEISGTQARAAHRATLRRLAYCVCWEFIAGEAGEQSWARRAAVVGIGERTLRGAPWRTVYERTLASLDAEATDALREIAARLR